MDLTFSTEQSLLRDSVTGFLSKVSQSGRNIGRNSSNSEERELWREFAAMGWLALPLPEVTGGFGQGPIDIGIVSEALGHYLIPVPYVSTVVLSGRLIETLGLAGQQEALLPAIAAGDMQAALAHSEHVAYFDLSHIETRARRANGVWKLDGHKPVVAHGGTADLYLVTARISESKSNSDVLGIFLVPADQPGLRVTRCPSIDGTELTELKFTDLEIGDNALLGDQFDVASRLEVAIDSAICAYNFEMLGIMEALLAATLEHTKTRQQFGRPLATNQVLRHRLADMSIACEEARALALRAAIMCQGHDPLKAKTSVSGAKAKIGQSALHVAHEAIQMHGAMGVTEEMPIGNFLKRAVALRAMLGSPEYHLRRHMRLTKACTSKQH